jgi:hypothetical protein
MYLASVADKNKNPCSKAGKYLGSTAPPKLDMSLALRQGRHTADQRVWQGDKEQLSERKTALSGNEGQTMTFLLPRCCDTKHSFAKLSSPRLKL